MELLVLVLLGLSVAFNIIIVIRKYRLKRYLDATLDLGLLVLIGMVFSGSFYALAVGTVGSMIISIYLYFRPVTLLELKGDGNEEDDYEYDY